MQILAEVNTRRVQVGSVAVIPLAYVSPPRGAFPVRSGLSSCFSLEEPSKVFAGRGRYKQQGSAADMLMFPKHIKSRLRLRDRQEVCTSEAFWRASGAAQSLLLGFLVEV